MKMNVIKSLFGTGLTLALTIALALPFTTSAQQIKGAQLLSASAPVSADAVAASAMPCAKCSDGLTSRVDTSVRGAMKPTVSVAAHSCCDTSVTTVGIGKQAKNVASHSCAMGSTAACCK